jgi:hypothetical protein
MKPYTVTFKHKSLPMVLRVTVNAESKVAAVENSPLELAKVTLATDWQFSSVTHWGSDVRDALTDDPIKDTELELAVQNMKYP